MKMKRFVAAEMRDAMQQVGETLGPDALILSSRRTEDGAEIIAAVDYEEDLQKTGSVAVDGPIETHIENTAPAPASAGPAPAAASPGDAAIANAGAGTIEDLRGEISALRNMLEVSVAQLGWDEARRRNPVRAALIARLVAMQMHPVIANRVADAVTADNDEEAAWQQALSIFEDMLPVAEDDLLNQGGRIALVGPTGVGKTTTIAKLAARFAMRHGRRHVALVSMDHYRIGAHEQLRTYGRLLGVPVHIAGDELELRVVLNQMHDRKLILIDTAGTSQRDAGLAEKFALLGEGSPEIRRYLVLSASGSAELTDDILASFSRIRPDKCILTKLDEATAIGGVLSVVIKHRLPLVWAGDGQQVPDDFHAADAHHLVRLAAALADAAALPGGDVDWLHAMGQAGSAAHAQL